MAITIVNDDEKIPIKVMIMTLMIIIKTAIHQDIIIVIIIIIIIMVVNSYPRSLFPQERGLCMVS